MILNGEIVELCTCCIIDGTDKVLWYDVKSDVELNDPNLVLLGKGKRTNIVGGEMSDRRVRNENPFGYFYKKIENIK